MKKLLVFTSILVLSLAGKAFAQKQKCELLPAIYPGETTFTHKGDLTITRTEYRTAFGNDTSISVIAAETLVEKKALSNCEILQFSFDYSEDKLNGARDRISLSFESISNKFLYDADDDRKLIFRADGKEAFSATLKQKSHDDLSKSIKREYLSLEFNIDFLLVKQLAEAKSVTIELGKRTFSLTANQHRAIGDFYNELNKLVSKDKAVR